MSLVLYRPEAERDLEDLARKTAERFGLAAGERFIDEVTETAELLAAQPVMGRPRPELGACLRSFPLGRVVVIYQPHRSGIEVVRILHGARDIPALF